VRGKAPLIIGARSALLNYSLLTTHYSLSFQGFFMTDQIGFSAGMIWQFLSENGESSPIKIKASLGLSNTLLYLALGWLAREDKVSIERLEHSYKISLK